jgi:7-keto-8-aminopelargonate synthetase-like enzyme
LNDLEDKLKWADRRDEFHESPSKKDANQKFGTRITRPTEKCRVLIITESIFSMDGDAAPLREIVELKNKFGAWLMVDEAHATGIFGENGRGLADEFGVSDEIEIQMGTLGKAFGASGGYICGARVLIDFLVNRARSFIFSTAPIPAAAAVATAGIQLAQSADGETRRKILRERINQLQSAIGNRQSAIPSAIVPLILGDEDKALNAAANLREQNIFVPAIRYPTVARGAARLRITLTAAHLVEDISELTRALKTLDIGL